MDQLDMDQQVTKLKDIISHSEFIVAIMNNLDKITRFGFHYGLPTSF